MSGFRAVKLQLVAQKYITSYVFLGGHQARHTAPGERILEAGQPDPAAYVFAAGRAHAVDDRGHEEYLSVGAILSNNEFRQVAKRVGVPTRRVTFHIERCRGLPPQASLLSRAAGASACDPFV